MAAISNSVVHLTMRFQKTVLSIGTGVTYQYENEYFIVTAWHNLTGRHSETLKCLSKNQATPDNVVVALAVSFPDFGATRLSITLPLLDEEKSLFFVHSVNWPRIDVAAIPFDPAADHLSELHLSTGERRDIRLSPIMSMPNGTRSEICPIQKYLVPDDDVIKKWLESVEVTEELFIPGYPHNIQDYYAQPVWKRATVASSVQLGWDREPKFLVDSASKSGMSGSPVLYYNSKGAVQIYGTRYQFGKDIAILVGIYVGRLGVEGEADPQIGTVWNQSVIAEIIQDRCLEKLPSEIELSSNELLAGALRVLAGYSRKGLESVKDPEMPSRHYACHQLMKDVNGRSSPKRALDAILEAAETYDGPFVLE
ncbi:MAG: hypothetical protein PHI11_05725 [Gallionella sp.]|nr:hypothetical protein [Gallionella sp.]